MASERCECRACRYDREELEEIELIDYLECQRRGRRLGPGNPDDPELWQTYERPAQTWWRAAIEDGTCGTPDLWWYAAHVMIGALRGGVLWSDLSGYDLTFETAGHSGMQLDWTTAEFCAATISFLRFLGQRSRIERGEVERLLAELEVWVPRLIDFLDEVGPWFEADGTRFEIPG